MKKLSLLVLIAAVAVSCKKDHPKDYLTFQGTLQNSTDSTLTISGKGFNKTIAIAKNGTFKDTMKVEKPSVYPFKTNSGKRGFVFLGNGFDLTLNGDAKDFMNSFKYSGAGSESNNFIIAQRTYGRSIGNPMEYFALDKEAFDAKLASVKKGMDSVVNAYKKADTSLVNGTKKQNNRMFDFLKNNYEKQHPLAVQRAQLMEKVAKGKPSPKFVDYENFKGGKTSLDDLKGKYVYVDVWATWCGPCIREIPSLKSLEKEYHGKNIEFVSISTDESRRNGGSWEKAHDKWKKFVADKSLSGTQLWSGKDMSFQQAYQINSIPRFILIDPQGNIVDNNAPRPSNPELKKLFTELGI